MNRVKRVQSVISKAEENTCQFSEGTPVNCFFPAGGCSGVSGDVADVDFFDLGGMGFEEGGVEGSVGFMPESPTRMKRRRGNWVRRARMCFF